MISFFFYSELEVIEYIFDELNGKEGFFVVFKIVDCVGIICFVIVNVFCKLESVGVIDFCLLGMKGIFICVFNDKFFVELEKLKNN